MNSIISDGRVLNKLNPNKDSYCLILDLANITNESTLNLSHNFTKIIILNQNLGGGAAEILCHLKFKNVNRLATGHLNINSLCNKFDRLKLLVKNSLDVFMISETKFDQTFPVH